MQSSVVVPAMLVVVVWDVGSTLTALPQQLQGWAMHTDTQLAAVDVCLCAALSCSCLFLEYHVVVTWKRNLPFWLMQAVFWALPCQLLL